ncbi:MAG: dTMP kinase [Thermoleophilia bacterium]|nr:dTMP kinase [Gaiellaceae bacterium]MDW8337833.1 dTMP kinase [Thermoleophilia bacterium]
MFVTFEGLDGSGKTTQAELLRARLEDDGHEVVLTREPGGTKLGERIRDLLLYGEPIAAWAEALLYAASRAQLVEEVIRPALARGAWVVCDRYLDSSAAYQGAGRGLGLDRVLELNLAAVDGLLPERTFLLQLSPEAVLSRLTGEHDRLERAGDEFRRRVDAAYRELAARFPERIVVLDAALPIEVLAEEVYGSLRLNP